jgi:hypothetical protein
VDTQESLCEQIRPPSESMTEYNLPDGRARPYLARASLMPGQRSACLTVKPAICTSQECFGLDYCTEISIGEQVNLIRLERTVSFPHEELP